MGRWTANSDFDYDDANGNFVKRGSSRPVLLKCTCCDWRGDLTDAIAHWRTFDHAVEFRGVTQDFSKYAVTPEELEARR